MARLEAIPHDDRLDHEHRTGRRHSRFLEAAADTTLFHAAM